MPAFVQLPPRYSLFPGLDIAQELGNTRTLNLVLLGALSGLLNINPETWVCVIRERGPAKAIDLNVSAFWRGKEVLQASRLADEITAGSVQ